MAFLGNRLDYLGTIFGCSGRSAMGSKAAVVRVHVRVGVVGSIKIWIRKENAVESLVLV